jgi:hypothetical protein
MEALFLPRPKVDCIIYEGMRIAGLPEGFPGHTRKNSL